MIVDLILSNAKAYINNEIVDCSLAINQGKIFRIAKEANMPKAETKIDLKNLLVLPGLIDVHVHLRDEGKAYKEDFCSGTAAAAAGGITTVLDMPNNEPVTMSVEALRNRMKIAERKILVNVGFYSEFPKNTKETEEIIREGAVAFKLFMSEQIGGLNIDNDHTLLETFKIISKLKVPIAVHAEDKTTLKKVEDELKRDNCNDVEAFLKAHSENVEVTAVKRLLKIAEQTNVHVHFCHISTENGLKAVIDGKKSGIKITCEATPHHLFLSVDNLRRIGTSALTMPPTRENHHIAALWEGIRNSWIDILASDHAPHTLGEKKAESVWDVKVGVPGLETTLPLLLTEVKHGRLSITDIVRLMVEKPAEVFGLEGRGCLKEENNADLVVVDLDRKYRIDASKFHSKAKYSPFNGLSLEGKPVKTFVGGRLIMDEGEIVA
ncbi:MAG: dihydroorotase family protein, partial [Candidatus Bathyarchaeota archaeon]|nr:dihydroorotase family protein [Candidatus Bathyarchaeota archaeon]